MNIIHNDHRIDTELLDGYAIRAEARVIELEQSKASLAETMNYFSSVRDSAEFLQAEDSYVTRTLSEWRKLYGECYLAVRQSSPNWNLKESVIFCSYGSGLKLVLSIGDSGRPDWAALTDREQELLLRLDPDRVLEFANLPEAIKDKAWETFREDMKSIVILSTESITIHADIDFWVVSSELGVSAQQTTYADGSVVIEIEATNAVGAEIGTEFEVGVGLDGGAKVEGKGGAKVEGKAEVGAGLEGTYLLRYKFDNKEDAERFIAELLDATKHAAIAMAVPVGGVGIGVGIGAAEIAKQLHNTSSLTNVIAGVGVYGEAGASGQLLFGPMLGSLEVKARGSIGVSRDFVANEFILDANFEANLSLGGGISTKFKEAEFNLNLVDLDAALNLKYYHGSEGDRVSMTGELKGDTALGLANLIPGIDIPSGAKAMIELELDLENSIVKEAWNEFTDDFNFTKLCESTSVVIHLQIEKTGFDANVTAKAFNVGGEIGIDSDRSEHWLTIIKEPGGKIHRYDP